VQKNCVQEKTEEMSSKAIRVCIISDGGNTLACTKQPHLESGNTILSSSTKWSGLTFSQFCMNVGENVGCCSDVLGERDGWPLHCFGISQGIWGFHRKQKVPITKLSLQQACLKPEKDEST
jgi:hypothetical protein